MAELWGQILRAIGGALGAIYSVIPSYGVAILLLTVLVRVVLIPLTIKQIRSMSAMQKIQPELKRLQQKHKGDRQKLNEEMMKLYREHGVNPLGGCFPLLLQAPVFIALYSVLRASIPVAVEPAQPVAASSIYTGKGALCIPEAFTPTPDGVGPASIRCDVDEEGTQSVSIRLEPSSWRTSEGLEREPAPFVTRCVPGPIAAGNVSDFRCGSPIGSGHLPRDSKLFADIVQDKAAFLGLELSCTPSQAGSASQIRSCAPLGTKAGGAPLVGYYLLVFLMAGTTYVQQKQMSAQATGPQAAQMKILTRIMPLFLGFISLSIPAGVILYWIASNLWTMGQQTLVLHKRQAAEALAANGSTPPKGGKNGAPAPDKKPVKPNTPPRQGKPKKGGGKKRR